MKNSALILTGISTRKKGRDVRTPLNKWKGALHPCNILYAFVQRPFRTRFFNVLTKTSVPLGHLSRLNPILTRTLTAEARQGPTGGPQLSASPPGVRMTFKKKHESKPPLLCFCVDQSGKGFACGYRHRSPVRVFRCPLPCICVARTPPGFCRDIISNRVPDHRGRSRVNNAHLTAVRRMT